MRVGYNRAWAASLLVLGVVCLLLGLVAFGADGGRMIGPLISGGVCALSGLMMMSKPYFEIGGGVVRIKAMLGPAERRYPYEKLEDVRVQGNRVWVGAKKTGITRMMADGRDWQSLVDYLAKKA